MEDDSVTVETVDDGVMEHSPLGPSSGSIPTSGESSYVDQILTVVSANGWFIILAIGVLYILWKQYVEPRMQSNSGRYQSTAATNLSAEEILARQEAMELARRKMQEQYDKRAQEFAIKQKEKEEKLRQEKLKELEKYGPGLGCTNKTKASKSSSEDSSSGAFKRKTEKSKLRPEYNPLMEGGSGTCFRPVRRGGAGGG